MNAVSLANGQKFIYTEISDFKPVRLVDIYYNEELVPEKMAGGDTLSCILGLTNPQRNSYHHDTNKSCHTRQPARKDLRYGLCDKSSTTELLV